MTFGLATGNEPLLHLWVAPEKGYNESTGLIL